MKSKSLNKKVLKMSGCSTPKVSQLNNIIDSLKILKEKNKFTDIDNKIQFLKSQLKSLLEEPVDAVKNEILLASDSDDSISRFSNINVKQKFIHHIFEEHDNSDINKIPIIEGKNSAHCLTPIFDKQAVLVQSKKLLGDDSNSLSKALESKVDFKDMDVKKFAAFEKTEIKFEDVDNYDLMESKKLKYRISQHELERLLYKSFLMQTLEKQSSGSEQVEQKLTRPNVRLKTSNLKTNKFWYKRSKKSLKRKFSKRDPQKFNRITCNVEMADEEPSTTDKNQEPSLIDLDNDLQSFNWDEPFVTDEKRNSFSSDLEIVEDLRKFNKQQEINKKKFSSKNNSGVEKNFDEKRIKILPNLELKNHYIAKVKENKNDESSKFVKKTTWECPICFEPSIGQEIGTTFCGHIFCKKCINDYHHTSKICPICSSDLSDKPIITLFNF